MTETESEICEGSKENNIPLYYKEDDVNGSNDFQSNIGITTDSKDEDQVILQSIPKSPTINRQDSSSILHSSDGDVTVKGSVSVNEDRILTENCESETVSHVENGELRNSEVTSGDIFNFDQSTLTNLVPESNDEDLKFNPTELRRKKFKQSSNLMKSADPTFRHSYSGISERIRQFIEDNESHVKPDQGREDNRLIETKRLTIDPDFEKKMKEVFPGCNMHYDNEPIGSRNKDKVYVKRKDSSCQIIEENLSPVSDTAKQIESHLHFTSAPKSASCTPRIPKLSRFARLERFLSEAAAHSDDNINHTGP